MLSKSLMEHESTKKKGFKYNLLIIVKICLYFVNYCQLIKHDY